MRTTLLYLIGWLPFPLLYLLAELLYGTLYYVAGYRKAVVRENLRRVFEQSNEKELTKRAKNYYRQLAQTALEIPRARTMSHAQLGERVRLENPELVRQYSQDFSRSVLLLSLHQGNWEWLLSGTAVALEQSLDVIYKPLHDTQTNNFMQRLRSRFGCRPVAVSEAANDLLRHRRTPRLLAMAADQAPGKDERQLECNFLQQPTKFHHTPAELASRTGMPVLFARMTRTGPGYYLVRFEPLTPPAGSDDARQITCAYAAAAERAILAEPQSWLWSHRRWKRN